MKMSDVFGVKVLVDYNCDEDNFDAIDPADGGSWFSGGEDQIEAAALAINNHDKLVDAANKLLVFVDAMQIIANRNCSHAEKVKRLKDGLKDHMLPYGYELSSLLKELDQ